VFTQVLQVGSQPIQDSGYKGKLIIFALVSERAEVCLIHLLPLQYQLGLNRGVNFMRLFSSGLILKSIVTGPCAANTEGKWAFGSNFTDSSGNGFDFVKVDSCHLQPISNYTEGKWTFGSDFTDTSGNGFDFTEV
jgi:hypothetical protein